jgi:hypothetical protein
VTHTSTPNTWEIDIERIVVCGQPWKMVPETLSPKLSRTKWTGDIVQVEELQLCKHEVLSSNSNSPKKLRIKHWKLFCILFSFLFKFFTSFYFWMTNIPVSHYANLSPALINKESKLSLIYITRLFKKIKDYECCSGIEH